MAPRFAFPIYVFALRSKYRRAARSQRLLRLAVLFRSVVMVRFAVRVLAAFAVVPRMMRTRGGRASGVRGPLRILGSQHDHRHGRK